MTVTLFQDRGYNGADENITDDMPDLAGTCVDRPSSIRLSDPDDAVLLFKNDNWRGGVHYLVGDRDVSDLGRFNAGGRHSFRNSIRSVRITPFNLPLNISLIENSDGDLPGSWTSEADATADIQDIVAQINAWYSDWKVLLNLTIEAIELRTSDRHFVMPGRRDLRRAWREPDQTDVIFIDRFTNENLLGNARFPCTGQRLAIARRVDDGTALIELTTVFMALTLAHELGHYLGLTHRTARSLNNNLMFASGDLANDSLATKTIEPIQIREMHQKLARNTSRRRDRRD